MTFSFSATWPLWIPLHPIPFRVDLDEVGLRLSQVLQGGDFLLGSQDYRGEAAPAEGGGGRGGWHCLTYAHGSAPP